MKIRNRGIPRPGNQPGAESSERLDVPPDDARRTPGDASTDRGTAAPAPAPEDDATERT